MKTLPVEKMRRPPHQHPTLINLLEIGILLLLLLFVFTPQLREGFVGDTIPPGSEFPYLIGSGAFAAQTFQQNGAIPLWNPLIGHGEPSFENLMSYLLNPFMTIPILGWGAAVGGKIAIALHIVLMALGGWTLGKVLRLRHGGSVLLGLLLAASGSFATPLNRGFYELGLSLAYVPWIFAGLFGLLYRDYPRLWLGVFVTAFVLMLFAGVDWFIVPTSLSCAVFVLFALIRIEDKVQRNERLRRIVLAGAFTLGLAALWLLPRLNSSLTNHETDPLTANTYDLGAILAGYFVPEKLTTGDWWFAYHFIIPAWFFALVVVVRLLLAGLRSPLMHWRILLPALILILFYSVWAQENTPLFHFLYQNTSLTQMRWPVRIAASASPLIALIAALWFDEIVGLLMRRRGLFRLGAALLAAVGIFAASIVYENWHTLFNFNPYMQDADYQSLLLLRHDHPGAFLSVLTEGQLPHIVAYDLMIRASLGNPGTFTNGLPSELAYQGVMGSLDQFAIASNEGYENWLRQQGYLPYANSPLNDDGHPALWYKPDALPYAFVVQNETLAALNGAKLAAPQVDAVARMEHHLDKIEFTVDNNHANSLLVVQEIDYPGWTATVDGQPAPILAFDGRMAVPLPQNAHTVMFEYHAPLLVIGLIVYVVVLIFFVGYLFHLDERLKGKSFNPVPLNALDNSQEEKG